MRILPRTRLYGARAWHDRRVGFMGGSLSPDAPVFDESPDAVAPLGESWRQQNLPTPTSRTSTLMQQALGSRAVLQVGYVGTKGTKLFRFRDINQPSLPRSPRRTSPCPTRERILLSVRLRGSTSISGRAAVLHQPGGIRCKLYLPLVADHFEDEQLARDYFTTQLCVVARD
jgi:hypothetical protein